MSLPTQATGSAGEIPFRRGSLRPQLAQLRKTLLQLQTRAVTAVPSGMAAVDRHLPGSGLALALHEIAPADFRSRPAAWGFLLALARGVAAPRSGLVLWPLLTGAEHAFGVPYGAGLKNFGFDPGSFLFARCAKPRDTLWAMEEGLRLGGLAAVVGQRTARMTLTQSRRLQLAAEETTTPIFLLREHGDDSASAARTLWRVSPCPAARDRFGYMTYPRWHVALERTRGGGVGEWVMEWDHDALCLRLPPALADRTVSAAETKKRA